MHAQDSLATVTDYSVCSLSVASGASTAVGGTTPSLALGG